MGWKNLPDMVMTSDNSDTSNTDNSDTSNMDGMEWQEKFYEQNHTISNLEYAKLNLTNVAIQILKTIPIAALFDTGAIRSCILQKNFEIIADKSTWLGNHWK